MHKQVRVQWRPVTSSSGCRNLMVQVKNTSPFASKPQLNRKGKQRTQYILADKGPRTQVGK